MSLGGGSVWLGTPLDFMAPVIDYIRCTHGDTNEEVTKEKETVQIYRAH